MIGGTDIILKTRHERVAMDLAVRAIRLAWEHAVFEDADTGETFNNYANLPLRGREELFIYRDADAQAIWKEVGPDPSVDGTMIFLIARRGELTIGLDDEPSPSTLSIVDVIRQSLRTYSHNGSQQRAAA